MMPKMLPKLKQKYGAALEMDVMSQCIIIDNNPILIKGEESRLVLCPTYDYIDMYDVLRLLPEDTLKDNYINIGQRLQTIGVYPSLQDSSVMSYSAFKMLYFTYLGRAMKDNLKDEKTHGKDQFWARLGNSFQNISSLKDANIKSINKSISGTSSSSSR